MCCHCRVEAPGSPEIVRHITARRTTTHCFYTVCWLLLSYICRTDLGVLLSFAEIQRVFSLALFVSDSSALWEAVSDDGSSAVCQDNQPSSSLKAFLL